MASLGPQLIAGHTLGSVVHGSCWGVGAGGRMLSPRHQGFSRGSQRSAFFSHQLWLPFSLLLWHICSLPSCSCPSCLVSLHLAAGQGVPTRASTSFRSGSHGGRRGCEGSAAERPTPLLHPDCYLTRLPGDSDRCRGRAHDRFGAALPPPTAGRGLQRECVLGVGRGESRQ